MFLNFFQYSVIGFKNKKEVGKYRNDFNSLNIFSHIVKTMDVSVVRDRTVFSYATPTQSQHFSYIHDILGS